MSTKGKGDPNALLLEALAKTCWTAEMLVDRAVLFAGHTCKFDRRSAVRHVELLQQSSSPETIGAPPAIVLSLANWIAIKDERAIERRFPKQRQMQ